MLKKATEMTFDSVAFQGKPALLTYERMDKATLPQGVYCYDIRHSDNDWGKPVTLENRVVVNFFGTIVTKEPIPLPDEGYVRLKRGALDFSDSKPMRLADFLDKPKKTIQEQIQAAKDSLRNQPQRPKKAPVRNAEER